MNIYTEKTDDNYVFTTAEILSNDSTKFETSNKMLRIYVHLISIALSCAVIIMSIITNVKLISQKRTARLRYFIHTSLCTSNLIVGIASIITPLFTILNYQFPESSLFKILDLQQEQHTVKWWLRLVRYIPIFSLISSLLHVLLLIVATFIFIKISEGYRWRIKPYISIISPLCTWLLSIAPFPFVFLKLGYRYLILIIFTFLCIMNFLFLFCLAYFIKAYRDTNYTHEREQFLFRRILAQQKKQRLQKKVVSLTLGFILSSFVSSYPYMVYYLTTRFVSSNIIVNEELVEELLMLAILIKCICDGSIYLFLTGCRRKRTKQTYSITFTHSTLSMSTRLSSENTLI